MKLQAVKVNPHSRQKILCSYCDQFKPEIETYADLDEKFRYVCYNCASQLFLTVTPEVVQ